MPRDYLCKIVLHSFDSHTRGCSFGYSLVVSTEVDRSQISYGGEAMTALQVRMRHRSHTQKTAEKYIMRLLKARRVRGFNEAYDLRSGMWLIEVKGVASKDANPKIHIERDSFVRKQSYDGRRFVGIIAAVRISHGNVIEARFGLLSKQHLRYKSLMCESEFLKAFEAMQAIDSVVDLN